ncbi:uncharacterized protein LOC135475610 [Liolophura sinensis]|uniref:uncharacterized protein LOC135475610 n=1 Tax=Liolophura sinensis TaxID=3198878 RepID=UPI003159249B
MFTVQKRAELGKKGYVVIEDVLSGNVCDTFVQQYQEWLSSFTKHNSWPFSYNSLIQRYKVGHAEPSWRVRLATTPVFAQLWGTEKLLTSFDAIAIGRPPEEGSKEFRRANQHWLHSDQSASQIGRHCVQGAVYLESADEDDWTLEVLEESHKYHQEFMQSHPKAFLRSSLAKFYRLRDGEPEWFEEKGCLRKTVAVPKGGMVLWDSRLIHANAKPVKGRRNPGRWRHVVFVCMGPAIWASDRDLQQKSLAYHQVL